MYKRIVIGVGIVVGVLAIAAPIAVSLNWAKKQNLAEQQRRVDRVASEVLRRMDLMADVDCPGCSRQTPTSRRGPLKDLGTDAAQVTVAAGSIVKNFDVIEYI